MVRRAVMMIAVVGLLVGSACTDGGESADEFCRALREPFPVARWADVGQIVFVQPDVTQPEMRSLVERVESDPNVAEVVVVDQNQAFEEYQALFADQPEMIEQIDPELLPPSLRIRFHDDLEGLAEPLDAHRSVYRVVDRSSVGVDLPAIDQAVRPLTIRSASPVPAAALWAPGGSNPDLVAHAPESLADDMAVLDEFWLAGKRETNDEQVVAAARQVAAFFDTECE